MSSTVETTGRPSLRRVIDKIVKILGKEWFYISEPLFKLLSKSLILLYYSLGIGIALAFINLVLGILTLSRLLPKKDRMSSQSFLSCPTLD